MDLWGTLNTDLWRIEPGLSSAQRLIVSVEHLLSSWVISFSILLTFMCEVLQGVVP